MAIAMTLAVAIAMATAIARKVVAMAAMQGWGGNACTHACSYRAQESSVLSPAAMQGYVAALAAETGPGRIQEAAWDDASCSSCSSSFSALFSLPFTAPTGTHSVNGGIQCTFWARVRHWPSCTTPLEQKAPQWDQSDVERVCLLVQKKALLTPLL